MAKFKVGPTSLVHSFPRAKFRLGQRIAIKQPYPARFGQIVEVGAETEDVSQTRDNVSIVVAIGYRYRVLVGLLGEDRGRAIWLDENMLETPVVDQVIERLRRGEI